MKATHRIQPSALEHVLGPDGDLPAREVDELARSLGTAVHMLEPGAGTFAIAYLLGQCAHESGAFRWPRELWDGAGAQAGYWRRRDLQGPGLLWPGIGKHYRGGGWIQTTGRANYLAAAALLRRHQVPARSAYWLAANAHRPMYASLLALAWWAPRMPTNMSGRDWTILRVSRLVNLGTDRTDRIPLGLEERRRYTSRALEVRKRLRPVRL